MILPTLPRLFLFSLLFGLVPLIAQVVNVTPTNTMLRPGQQTTVEFQLVDPTNSVWGVQFDIDGGGSQISGMSATIPPAVVACNMDVTRCLIYRPDSLQPLGPSGVAQGTLTVPLATTLDQIVVAVNSIVASDPAGNSVTVMPGLNAVIVVIPFEDVDGDGDVDFNDLSSAISQIFGTCSTGDVNQDGSCNIFDVFRVLVRILTP